MCCCLQLVCCYELVCGVGLHGVVPHEDRALGRSWHHTHNLILFQQTLALAESRGTHLG